MKLEEVVWLNELFDAYGELLSKNQKEIMAESIKYNLSFSEIAENRKTSRQSSFITLKLCIKKLEEFENKLGFIKKKNLVKAELEKALKSLEKGDSNSAEKVIKKLTEEI